MLVVALLATTWVACLAVVLALCWAAAEGDRVVVADEPDEPSVFTITPQHPHPPR